MRPSQYSQLCHVARRIVDDVGEAEDIVQDAYLAAFLSGFVDFDAVETRKWLTGTVRNKARMAVRSAVRRRGRESQWQLDMPDGMGDDHQEIALLLNSLPASLKAVAALALSGHSRKEILYMLKVTDAALRQRIRALKRHVAEADVNLPTELVGLTPGLAYGRMRVSLLSMLTRRQGFLASHDPDGHLFVIGYSQNGARRQ